MNSVHEYGAAITSYVTALLVLVMDHSSTIMSALGFVLLIARLIQELPRAYRVIFKRKSNE